MAEPIVFELATSEEADLSSMPGRWLRAGAVGPTELTVWRANLPAPQAGADLTIARAVGSLEASRSALPEARRQLDGVAELANGARSYDLEAGGLSSAQMELLARLRAGDGRARSTGLAFGLGDTFDQLRNLSVDVASFYANVRQAVSQYALVEAAKGGRPLARTRIAWGGGFQVFQSEGLSLADTDLLRRLVEHVLATRQTWVRIALLIAAGAASLASTFAGNPLGIAAVYGFVRRIVSEAPDR